ncbi:MAG: UDP-N-acetylglucosamine 2-epimerase (non-hydrolyzing) [Cryomorphaceae bacterium]|nr:UDP-N-acetylglucosamine 2-epimerase (non-hydrolyzing) [Cryomorphaceae bacterium]
MNILTVLGARPQFIKAAAVSQVFLAEGIEEDILHTGQHFDDEMDRVFFDELEIPHPIKNLSAGGGHHGAQTAKMMIGIESFILDSKKKYDRVLVYGDTNSTLAAALVSAKLQIPLAHVEAGLRSHNLAMPEEINRKLTDHVSQFLFCPSDQAVQNLKSEGITDAVYLSGDVMLDALNRFKPKAIQRSLPGELHEEGYYLFTVHRPYNTDQASRLGEILCAIGELPYRVFWPVHPRLKSKLHAFEIPKNVLLSNPVGYLDTLNLLSKSIALITDSGGMQKEAYWMQKNCVTLRSETEWTETLERGWNQLVVNDYKTNIPRALQSKPGEWMPKYGNGQAAKLIAETLK